MTKWTIDILPLKAYYSTIEETEMTAKKNPRSEIQKPRSVIINPKPAKNGVVYTENLVRLTDMVQVDDDVLGFADDDHTFIVQARDETGSDPIMDYGIFLGYADNDEFIPEVIVDEKGAFVLIFHDVRK